jgi:diaminopimelate decarboxylase
MSTQMTQHSSTLLKNDLTRIPATEYAKVYQWALQEGLIDQVDSAIYFYSLDQLDNRLGHLTKIFPKQVKHAIAIKTNPLVAILKHITNRGYGLEAASIEEVHLAKAANCNPAQIVFDSPVKRKAEIQFCADHCAGMILNANCLDELPRLKDFPNLRKGLRVNPLLNTGAPAVFDVSKKVSKFGVPISMRTEIIQAYLDYPDLEGIHMHIGSQISKMDATAKAIRLLYELGEDIKTARAEQGIHTPLRFLDIGGGFPATYDEGPQTGMEIFMAYIQDYCPTVFEEYEVFTEFGRFVHVHNGWVLSDVEYVTPYQDQPIAMVHAGADMFVREIYQNDSPKHQMTVLNAQGQLKTTPNANAHIAGPLCFAGDFIDKNRALPKIDAGDKLIIADAGANAIGMWSRHCSRACPKVIAYSLNDQSIKIIKEREAVEDIVDFWS